MPIKFRCKYCQQFLGISRSRAGAVVDCPRCARSVRVPELDGRTRKMPEVPKPKNDSALISALSELSSLDGDTVGNVKPSAKENAAAPVEPAFSEPIDLPFSEKPVSIDRRLPAAMEAQEEVGLVDPQYSDSPVALTESLSELASLEHDSEDGPVSTELLQEMRTTSGAQKWMSMPALLLSFIALIGGLAGGWWLAESGLVNLDRFRPKNSAPKPDGSVDAASELPNMNRQVPNSSTDSADVVVQGTIQFQDPSGHLLPDAGALILLLPSERIGTLLLDARSLNLLPAHPDFQATKAALNSFNATIVQADEEGLFAVSYSPDNACKIIVISKHSQRPDDVPLRADIQQLLKMYFQSPNHLCGRLSVQIAEAKPSATLDFQFDARQ